MKRTILTLALVGALAAPASAFLFGGTIVHDLVSYTQFVSQAQSQIAMVKNMATNLTKLPTLNLGNIAGEVQSVSGQVESVPATVRGIAAADKVLLNLPADAARADAVNAQTSTAEGVVAQQQVTNEHLGQISGTLQQGNAMAAAAAQEKYANTVSAAGDITLITGNEPGTVPTQQL